ncbi:hypothetical protein BN6_33950 [Saccharothrix espanaensis DSM 44229]|uniref:Uncharacterized protein n=1 Tax=Saccharothrix espanaensis (strain ATCC 51144 / DSM 44229 / JCM 9112 / NBRC 15066 / NRRL 15764) TaxID=1179773 RepID=K0K2C3_SACES|nr:hypothetical protein BN6_33950 [Saccharothrix espanaensis DSM 44229]
MASGNGKGQIFVKVEVIKTVLEHATVNLIEETMRLARRWKRLMPLRPSPSVEGEHPDVILRRGARRAGRRQVVVCSQSLHVDSTTRLVLRFTSQARNVNLCPSTEKLLFRLVQPA